MNNSSSKVEAPEHPASRDLKRQLWASLDNIRGNSALKFDEFYKATFGLFFLSYLNRQATEPFGDAQSSFELPEEATLERLLSAEKHGIGDALNKAMRSIEQTNEQLHGISFSDYGRFDDRALYELTHTLHDACKAASGNELGEFFEFLLDKVARAGGKRTGEFSTPSEVASLMIQLIDPSNGMTVYDPCAGTAGFLRAAIRHVENKESTAANLGLYGQESSLETLSLAKMGLAISGRLDADLQSGNTLLERISKPSKRHDDAGELGEPMIERPVEFVPDDEATEVVEPTDGAFDLPASSVAAELAEVLLGRADPASAVRSDEVDVAFGEPITQRVAVGRLVVDEHGRDERRGGRVEQRLDKIHLGCAGRVGVDRERQAAGVGEDHDLGPLAPLGLADHLAPFLAGANVPSAKPSRQSILPSRSSRPSSRSQARSSVPSPTHSVKRRCTVERDGNRGGRSFHRAPLRSIHSTPSKHARGSAIGRPPFTLGSGLANKSAISSHCSSLSSACRSSAPGSVLDPAETRDRSVIKGLLSDTYTQRLRQPFS